MAKSKLKELADARALVAKLESAERQRLESLADEVISLADGFGYDEINKVLAGPLGTAGYHIRYMGLPSDEVAAKLTAFIGEQDGGTFGFSTAEKKKLAKMWGCNAADIDKTLARNFLHVSRTQGLSIEWGLKT